MGRPKSLIVSMDITSAGKAHACRHNSTHQFQKGDPRLTIKVDGDEHHYCLTCARAFLVKDIERLQKLLADVEAADKQ
jgi:hypothetical protein